MNINQFISEHYDVIYQSKQVGDFTDAEEFLLGDNHASEGHDAVNSLFINIFANKNDVVMVEGIDSMSEIKPHDARSSIWLKTEAKIMGWDISTFSFKDAVSALKATRKGADLERENRIFLKQWMEAQSQKEEKKAKAKCVQCFKEMSGLLPEIRKTQLEVAIDVISTFPGRVNSMMQSMDKAKKVFHRTFLIAGLMHFKNKQSQKAYSLDKFYKFLDSRKFVVLFPKDGQVSKLGAVRKKKIDEAIDQAAFEEFMHQYGSWVQTMRAKNEKVSKMSDKEIFRMMQSAQKRHLESHSYG